MIHLKNMESSKKYNKDCKNERCWLKKNNIDDINILDILDQNHQNYGKKSICMVE